MKITIFSPEFLRFQGILIALNDERWISFRIDMINRAL